MRKGRKKTNKNKPKTIKKMEIGIYISISIITLNVNGLNAPTKRHRVVECLQKQDPYICYLQETHFRPKDTYRLKVRGWKKICKWKSKESWSSNTHIKVDFKDSYKRQGRTLHNDQRIKPRRR